MSSHIGINPVGTTPNLNIDQTEASRMPGMEDRQDAGGIRGTSSNTSPAFKVDITKRHGQRQPSGVMETRMTWVAEEMETLTTGHNPSEEPIKFFRIVDHKPHI